MTKFQYTFRYIDDLCLFNVSNPRDFLSPDQSRNEDNPYWIYPFNVLEIKEEISEFSQADPRKGITTQFINAEFRVNETIPQHFSFCKFDKRRSLPFTYIQYIKFASNRSVHQAYNIAISQVLPILYISSTDSAASEEVCNLINTKCNNGFYKPRVIKTITSFLLKGIFPGIRVDVQRIISSLPT
jgi:hypothetical protein